MAEDKIIERVTKLLALAEHPNTPAPEAELALRQANKLIAKHAIEEALLRAAQTVGQRRALKRVDLNIGGGTFRPYLYTVLSYAVEANRVSCAIIGDTASLFGADEDVAWTEMLFSMIKLQFLMKLDPKWDEDKSYDENVYTFKVAGYKWADINAEAVKHGSRDARKWVEVKGRVDREKMAPYYAWESKEFRNLVIFEKAPEQWSDFGLWEEPTDKLSGILIAAYKRWAANIGDDAPVSTQDHRAYRLSYAEAFRARMRTRFLAMIADAEAERDTIPGAALALADMKADADRMMWDAFPNLSPEEMKRRRQERMEQEARENAERQAKLDAMTEKQRTAFLEREEREQRRNESYWRKQDERNSFRFDAGARRRGEEAANSVDLSRKAGRAEAAQSRGEIG